MPGQAPQAKKGSLIERYVAPPFSVLDAKQGYWQTRKRAWLDLGVDDPASRRQVKSPGSVSGNDPRYYQEKARVEIKLKRRLSHREFQAKHYVPLAGSRLRVTSSGSMLSLFDPVLCEVAYRWFSPRFGRVLDPFAGGAVRGIVASALGREYFGVDLSAHQVEANRRQWSRLSPQLRRALDPPTWCHGDGRDVLHLAPGLFDFLFTCPPYGNLERYSSDPRDLSALKHPAFLDAYRQIIAASTAKLRADRFACIVVGDFRDSHGFYRNFVSHTIAAFEGCGLRLYNEAILATMMGTLPMRVAKQFDASRKLGKAHQNVLVFVKGDPKLATAAVGRIEVAEDPAVIASIGTIRRTRRRRRAGSNQKPRLQACYGAEAAAYRPGEIHLYGRYAVA